MMWADIFPRKKDILLRYNTYWGRKGITIGMQ